MPTTHVEYPDRARLNPRASVWLRRQHVTALRLPRTMGLGHVRDAWEVIAMAHPVSVHSGGADLDGDLVVPHGARAVVVFAHGSGSSRHSPRNRSVAERLQRVGLATLLFDLLDSAEERAEQQGATRRFDVELLTPRLIDAVQTVRSQPATSGLPVGVFGASTGAAVALLAAARRPELVSAVVSRGGRPDLAGDALADVAAPVLLIVGERDPQVLALNQDAAAQLASGSVVTVGGAGHLFEEPGALGEVTRHAADWFTRHLRSA